MLVRELVDSLGRTWLVSRMLVWAKAEEAVYDGDQSLRM